MSKIIKTQLQKTPDISKLVKKFITSQLNYQQAPFAQHPDQPEFSPSKRINCKKGSLTDWRALFNSHRKYQKKGEKQERQYKSDRKFDITQPPFSLNSNLANKTVRQNKKFTPQKTSTSFRQSNLESALVQNLYESQYIKQRKIQTAKIRKYYEQTSQERPVSFNLSTRKNIRRKQFVRIHGFNQDFDGKINDLSIDVNADLNVRASRGSRNGRILNGCIWPQKYETVKINKKYIRKNNEVIIEGEKKKKDLSGLRFYGALDRSIG